MNIYLKTPDKGWTNQKFVSVPQEKQTILEQYYLSVSEDTDNNYEFVSMSLSDYGDNCLIIHEYIKNNKTYIEDFKMASLL